MLRKKTAAEKIAAREKETKKAQDRLNRKKEKVEMVKEQLKEQQEKETEKARKKLEEQRKKETERAQKKAQKQQHQGTAPTVPENTQQTGQNGGKPAEESSHLAQSNLQRGAGHPEHTTPSRPQLDGSRHDGSMTKGGNMPASTTDPTEDIGRHAQRHVQKGAGKPELTTLSQPQPGGSHHDGSMTERGYMPASTTDPAEERNRPAQNNLQKGDGIPEPATPSQPQPEGSQHDGAMTGRGYTPATTTIDDTSRLPEDNVQSGAGNPEHTSPSQPQNECGQHDGSMTGRGYTPCGATDGTLSCAPKELKDTNVTADNDADKAIAQGSAADGGNDPPQSNLAEDEVKKAEMDKCIKKLMEENEKLKEDLEMQKLVPVAPDNSPSDNTALDKRITQRTAADGGNDPLPSNFAEDEVKEADKYKYTGKLEEESKKLQEELLEQKQVPVAPDNTALEVRCMVVVDSGGIQQTISAREQFLKRVKTSLSSDGINLDTANMAPDEEMDEDKAEKYTKPLLLIVPCLVTSHVENNITKAIHKITIRREHKKLLVAFHPRAAHAVHVPDSRHQVSPEIIRRCEIIVDVIFDRVSGAIFPIQINVDAESRMTEYLRGCGTD